MTYPLQQRPSTITPSEKAASEPTIVDERYFTAAEGCVGRGCYVSQYNYPLETKSFPETLQRLVICVLVLSNGYTAVGSAAINEDSGDIKEAEHKARGNALGLMGGNLKNV